MRWLQYGTAAALVASLGQSTLFAQAPRTIAGVGGGYTATEHVWRPTAPVESVGGIAFGGFVTVQTPLSWLLVGGEALFSQRGSNVLVDVGGVPTPGGIRTDYLTFIIRVQAALPLGPARVHLVVGPLNEFILRSRLDPSLTAVLDEESSTSFGLMAGAGVGVWVTERAFAEIEARIIEGAQSAYSGDFLSVRSRSRELVARVGIVVR